MSTETFAPAPVVLTQDQAMALTATVAAALGHGTAVDYGGGPIIEFHGDSAVRDMAWLDLENSDPLKGGSWVFVCERDVSAVFPDWSGSSYVTSELTLEADPADVASWLAEQMALYGTPTLDA